MILILLLAMWGKLPWRVRVHQFRAARVVTNGLSIVSTYYGVSNNNGTFAARRSGFAAARAAALEHRAAISLAALVTVPEGLAVIHMRITDAQIVARVVVGFAAIAG